MPALENDHGDDETLIFAEFQRRGFEFQAKLSRECLLWGLCCGNLTFATRALSIYRRFLIPADGAVVHRLLANVRLAAAIVVEKVGPVLVDYISNLWETVRVVIEKLQYDEESALVLSVQFLECNDPEIRATLFAIIAFYFAFPKSINAVKMDSLKTVLTRPFAIATGNGLFKLLLAMGRAQFTEPLGKPDVLATILLLTLPLYGESVTDRSFFAAMLKDHEAAPSLTQVASAKVDDEVLEFETALQIVNTMDDHDVTIVANLLGTLAAANKFARCKYVYSFVITLIGNGRSPECFAYFVQCIADDQENLFLKTGLFEILKPLGDSQSQIQSIQPEVWPDITPLPLRPPPAIVDFTSIHDLPPLFITDPVFRDATAAREAALQVRGLCVEPIGRWVAEIGAMDKNIVERSGRGEPLPSFREVDVARDVRLALKGAPIVGGGAKRRELIGSL
jgi:hypothetical protein